MAHRGADGTKVPSSTPRQMTWSHVHENTNRECCRPPFYLMTYAFDRDIKKPTNNNK